MGLLSALTFGGAAAPILGTIGAAATGGGLGYAGVKDTNNANEQIASARNVFEREEAIKAREFSGEQASINRDFTSAQALRQMDFQERMSNTAVSRRMKDLKTSGINPILAGQYEAGTPAGAASSGGIGATAKANAHGYTAQNKIQSVLDNMDSALRVKRLYHQARQADAEAGKSENVEKMTSPSGSLLDDANTIYKTGKHAAKHFWDETGKDAVKQFWDKGVKKVASTAKQANSSINEFVEKSTAKLNKYTEPARQRGIPLKPNQPKNRPNIFWME